MMISEKMVFTSSNGNHLVLYARPPAGSFYTRVPLSLKMA